SAEESAYYDFGTVGSTVGLTGSGGNYVNAYRYLPFGERLTATETVANPFQFVGAFGVMAHPDGLHLIRARFYMNGLGRLMSGDPLGYGGGQINLYAYAANDPISSLDATGDRARASGGGPAVKCKKTEFYEHYEQLIAELRDELNLLLQNAANDLA